MTLKFFVAFFFLLQGQIEILLLIIDIFIENLFGVISDKEKKKLFFR